MWQPGKTLDEIERETIEAALKFYQGNKTQTAQSLNITVRTLYNKLERYESEDSKRDALVKERQEFLKKQQERLRHGKVQPSNSSAGRSGVELTTQAASE